MTDDEETRRAWVERSSHQLGINCVCDVVFATRQAGDHTITRRVHRDGCALGRHLAEQSTP